MSKSKITKDKLGYLHTQEELAQTANVLENWKNGDIIFVNRYTNDRGDGHSVAIVDGKEWNPSYCKWYDQTKARTLQQLVEQGYNLDFAGRYGDGNKCAWWNDCRDLSLIDISVLNQ